MKYDIPESEDVEWQQEMLREIDNSLEDLRCNHEYSDEIETVLTDISERIASLRAYSGY